jgi:enoyl-CoA hydratase/carnithine racemase
MILSTGYGESGLRTVHVGRGLALSSLCICSSNSSANARGWLDDEPGSSHNRSAETGQGQRSVARKARRWAVVGECVTRGFLLRVAGDSSAARRDAVAPTHKSLLERERTHAQRLARPAARVGRSQLRRKHSPEVSRVASFDFRRATRFKTRLSHSSFRPLVRHDSSTVKAV